MSYIGNPIVSTDFPVDYFSGNNSTTAFTLSIAPASVNALDVQVGGVPQSPQTYTVSGTTLTFSTAPPTGSSNIIVRHKGIAGIPNVPSAGSVVPTSMSAGAPYWDANGNLVVGGTSAVNTGASTGNITINGSGNAILNYTVGGVAKGWVYHDGTNFEMYNNVAGANKFFTNGTERMRLTSSGELLWGCTATSGSVPTTSGIAFAATSTAYDNALYFRNGADPTYVLDFYNTAGTRAGKVTVNASTTSYDTSSDYRLKENVAPMQNALATVALLKPVTYSWKNTGEAGQGFIAHELQEILPDAVTGEKDGVDKDGNPDYQGVDSSFLVATLTAAIQELKAELDATKAEVAALKGTV